MLALVRQLYPDQPAALSADGETLRLGSARFGPGTQATVKALDPRELVRDGGHRLERVIPRDMFPQTQHLECVADLRRVG